MSPSFLLRFGLSGCALITSFASLQSAVGHVSVLTWPDGRKAAYSLSFDDGSKGQYENGVPLLDQYGMKATFYLNGGWMSSGWTMSWANALELSQNGHEIGNHTLTHPSLSSIDLGDENTADTAIYQIVESKKRIEEQVISKSSQVGMTFAYPYSNPNITEITNAVLAYHEAGRDSSGSTNSGTVPSWGDLGSRVLRFSMAPRSLENDLPELTAIKNELQNTTIPSGRWGILLLHGVDADYTINPGSLSCTAVFFEELLKVLDAEIEKETLWVDTVLNVTRYIREREAFTYRVGVASETEVVIAPEDDGLEDTIYNYPLSADITVPSSWNGSVQVEQNGSFSVSVVAEGDGFKYVRTELIPTEGAVTIRPAPSWAGYSIESEIFVNTGSFLGYLAINRAPWVWSYTLSSWLFLREESITRAGAWIYFLK